MRIDSHISSLALSNRLNQTSRAVSRALERLSTGRRVNRAQDDVASFSASTTLEAQVRGLRQGVLNLNQVQGALQTSESAVSSQLELVQKMREIAVQASSGTITTTERSDLNKQLQSLFDEFTRVGQTTESFGKIHLGLDRENTIDLAIEAIDEEEIFTEDRATGKFTDTGLASWDGSFSILADMNQDGLDDIVMGVATGVGIRISNGDGTFQSVQSFAGSTGAIYAEDMNDDGILDVVVHGAVISTYLGNGDGSLSVSQSFTPSALVNDIAIGDFDGDGKKDVMALMGASISLLSGSGDGSFTQSITRALSASGITMASADIDNDGDLDLAIGSSSRNASIFLGNGNGTFSQGASITTVTYNTDINSLTLKDFNNDGNVDFVGTSTWVNGVSTGNLSYATGRGDGTFNAVASFNSTVGDVIREVADMDGDGLPDLLSIRGYHKNLGGGTFSSSVCSVQPFATIPGVTRYGDVNGDGIFDILSIDYDSWGTNVYLGQSNEVSALDKITVRTQAHAQNLLTVLDNALQNLTEKQSNFGALHSRIDSAISSNLLLSENLEEARSQMVDADIAVETAELVRNQILQQAQVAVMSQANLQMQKVIGLLNF